MTTRITLLAALSLLVVATNLPAQSTGFTYQGRLTADGTNVNGLVELQCTLWNALNLGTQTGATTPASIFVKVTNGQFTALLDFGAAAYDGTDRYLQVEVRTALGPFIPLAPRQRITATPYALMAGKFSGTVPAGGLGGVYGNAVTFSNANNVFNGTFRGGGVSNPLTSPVIKDAGGLTIATAEANYLKISGTNFPGLIIEGDYRNGMNGERYRTDFASGGNPRMAMNGYIYMDGNPYIDAIGAAHNTMIAIGNDVGHGIVTYGAGTVLEAFAQLPDGRPTNSVYTNGALTASLDGRGQFRLINRNWMGYDHPQLQIESEQVTNGATISRFGFMSQSDWLQIAPLSADGNMLTGVTLYTNGRVSIGDANWKAGSPGYGLNVPTNVFLLTALAGDLSVGGESSNGAAPINSHLWLGGAADGASAEMRSRLDLGTAADRDYSSYLGAKNFNNGDRQTLELGTRVGGVDTVGLVIQGGTNYGNGGGLSNAVTLIAGSGVTLATNDGRTFTISAGITDIRSANIVQSPGVTLTLGGAGGTNVLGLDLSTNDNFVLTATTNFHFAMPANLTAWKRFTVAVVQDGIGNRTWSFQTNGAAGHWSFQGSYVLDATTNAGAMDVLECQVSPWGTNVMVKNQALNHR